MLRVLGLKQERTKELSIEEQVSKIIKQAQDFEICLTAMDYVLDDRPAKGLALIEGKDEAIYKLATGVVLFIEFTLGFEEESRIKAQKTLAEAENLSYKAKNNNEKLKLKTSSIYPPGTEYAVAHAEATLLNALTMLLSESVIDSAKALYKLRRAYYILDEIHKSMMSPDNKKTASGSSLSLLPDVTSISLSSDASNVNKFADIPLPLTSQQKRDAQIVEQCEKVYEMRKNRFDGLNIGNSSANSRLRTDLGLHSEIASKSTESIISTANDPNTSTIDEFIHSGVNLCFGILQVVLSLIPPTIGKVLAVVGFKGSREDGLRAVWKSAEKRNIHGGIGLLTLLVFYDGPFQFTDVDFDVPSATENRQDQFSNGKISNVPSLHSSISKHSQKDLTELKKTLSRKKMDLESRAQAGYGEPTLLHPGKKLESSLLNARALFPHSALWLLQEGRMLASKGRLEEAVELMDSLTRKIEMKQVEALLVFDRAMILIFMNKYERAAKDFLRLVDINAWSHALYFYFAGACYLESWRMCETKLTVPTGKDDIDLSKKEWYKEQAEKYLSSAPEQVGKRKFMSKPMPFDRFLLRKTNSIKEISKRKNLSLVDSCGTSLIHELSYFWNGYNRMPEENLKLAIKLLGFNADPDSEYALLNSDGKSYSKILPESKDESMIRYTLQAITLRRLGKIEEGRKILDSNVLSEFVLPNNKFIKMTNDPWLYPISMYERALFCWKEKSVDGLEDAKEWLKNASEYSDDYELSTRVGMKIKAATDRLENL